MPSVRARLAVALAIAAASAAVVVLYYYFRLAPGGWGSDFDQVWAGARAVLDGRDPYAEVGPGRPFPWRWGLAYPLPGLLLVTPLALLPLPVARALFVFASAFLLAWVLTRESWSRLPVFVAPAYVNAVLYAQWSPLFLAAMLEPRVGRWLVAVKPTLGCAVVAAMQRRRDVVVAGAFALVLVLISFALYPHWLAGWLAAIRTLTHLRQLVFTFGGPVMLLAALRWRRPEARALIAFACVPITAVHYEALAAFVVARTFRETVWLAFLMLVAKFVASSPPAPVLADFTRRYAPVMLWCVFVPALVMVLRRPNVAE